MTKPRDYKMPRRNALRMLSEIREGVPIYAPRARRILVRGPDDIHEQLKEPMGKMDREIFLALLLNARNAISHVFLVSVGSLNASIVHPREVFSPAIRHRAACIVLCHNHPSGQSDPSDDDLALTRRLVQVGELVGIPVMDHLIIGNGGFTSLKQLGYI